MTTPESERALFPNLRSVRREDRGAGAFRGTALLLLERLALLWAIMIFTGIGTFGVEGDPSSADSNAVNTYSNIMIILVFGGLTVANFRKTTDFLPHSYLLIAFVVLAIASAMWSIEPALTLRRVGTLGTTLIVSAYLVWRYDFPKAISIIGHGLLLVLILSLLTVIFLPHIGITQYENGNDELVGTWKGVISSKNSLGWVCIAGVQIYAWRFLVEPEKRLRHFIVIAFMIFMAAETRSATALVSIALGIFVLAVLNLRSWQSPKRIALEGIILGSVILAIFIVSLAPTEILALLGKDPTLTGRVPLWHSVIDSISRRPLLGYGYAVFWLNTNPEVLHIWAVNQWEPGKAHNAFLDVMLDLGVGGLAIAVLFLIVSTKRALTWCKQPDAPWAKYVGSMFIVFIVTCFDETAFMRGGGDIFCLLTSFGYFTLVRAHRRATAEGPDDGDKATRERPAAPQPLRF